MPLPCYGGATTLLLLALFLTSYHFICGDTTRSSKLDVMPPIVTIHQGTLQGFNMLTNRNRTIYAFTGVPYARPPVGELRFKAPVAPTAWSGTYNATNDDKKCLQMDSWGNVEGNEDCLYLDLYTPRLPSKRRSTLLPVMLYIVGGSFMKQVNNRWRYGPDFLLDKDVILIVPSYRVGALGFLSTGDAAAPGNFGLKDIVRALKWTQENVKHFGGDPDRVTLFGASSGAMSVSFLALSKATEGLFHQIITQSGSALSLDLQEPNESYVTRATQLGEHFGCPTDTSEHLVDCLRDLPGSQLVDTYSIFYEFLWYPTNVWFPTVEPDIEGALITKSPARLIAEGKLCDMPWMNSNVRDEGLRWLIHPRMANAVMSNLDIALPLMAGYARSSSNVTAYTDGLKSYYLNDLTADRSLLISNISMLMGDITLLYPSYSALQQRLSYATKPSYSMSFEHRGVFSYSYYFSGGKTIYTGVPHGEEIIYLFKDQINSFGPSWYKYSEDDLTLVEEMVEMWTSFATCGEPTPADTNDRILWKPYTSKKNYLQVGNGFAIGMQVKYGLRKERMEFLDTLTAAVPWKEPTPANADGGIRWELYTPSKNYLQVGNGPTIGMQVRYGLARQRMEFLDDLAAAIP